MKGVWTDRGQGGQSSAETHTGILLQVLQEVLGRKQEVEEVAEAVSTVTAVHHCEDLRQQGGGRGLEGREDGGQRLLDAHIQRLRVLQETQQGGHVDQDRTRTREEKGGEGKKRRERGKERKRSTEDLLL